MQGTVTHEVSPGCSLKLWALVLCHYVDKMFRNLDYIAYRMIYIKQYFVSTSENFTATEPIYGKEEYQLFDKSHFTIGNHFQNR